MYVICMSVGIRFLFTYWVVAWTVAYFIAVWGFKSQYAKDNFNPLFAIICEAVATVGFAIHGLFNGVQLNSVTAMYVCMNAITKGVPIYLLWNTRINYVQDAANAATLFCAYYVFLLAHGKNLRGVYSPIYRSVLNKTYRPILLTAIQRLFTPFYISNADYL
jgi:hypothetical protein